MGIRGWSFAPGRSSAAYTAGTTPNELNSDSKIGLTAPLNGEPIKVVTRFMSKSVVPFGGDERGDGAEAEPERDEPEAAGIGPRDVVIGAVR